MDFSQIVTTIMTLINIPLKILYSIDQAVGLYDWTGIDFGG